VPLETAQSPRTAVDEGLGKLSAPVCVDIVRVALAVLLAGCRGLKLVDVEDGDTVIVTTAL
jgi:hypothetical protein